MKRLDYDRYRDNLRIDTQDGIMTLALHNPEKLNANTDEMHWALSRIWDDIDADPDVSVVIFTGSGDRAFSAGGDPAKMKENALHMEHWVNTVREAKRIIFGMLACDKPIIARVNGHAVGFGSTLALAADLIVGVEGAKFGDPHCSSGLVCGDGGALLWPQQIGYALAKEFLYTGRLVTMEEAAKMGLINYAVPREELDAKVNELAQAIRQGAGRAIQLTKNVMNIPLRQAAISSMDLGMANELMSSQTEDHMEATNAFIEKRAPRFSGR
jgi:enoyl-CoA hydratase